jgi:glutamate-1-semialdehyde 2,1-aminomutase
MTTDSMMGSLADVEREVVDRYRKLTPASAAHSERHEAVTPAAFLSTPGITPYPLFIDHVDGAYMYDIDGRQLVDFFNAHSGAILGHNNAVVRRAIHDEVERGLVFGLVRSPRELEVAERLVERIPSLEKVRFSPSGSEAVMRTLRVARAFTGRDRIAKTDSGYHGSHDLVWYGPAIAHAQHPGTRQLAPGISANVTDEVVLLPFNQLERSAELVTAHASSLAAIIVEPVLGMSALPASVEYLRLLRELATRHGIVLIFDEMICLGAARGGVQELLGVTPDLTTAGKTVAHGLPLAFYGGRADIMAVTARGPAREVPPIIHGGTYQRHNLSLAAASAALEQQDRAFFGRLQSSGERLRRRLGELAAEQQWPLQVTGISHLWHWHWATTPVVDHAPVTPLDQRIRPIMHTMLSNLDVYVGGTLSGAHTDDDVDRFVAAFADVVGQLDDALPGWRTHIAG